MNQNTSTITDSKMDFNQNQWKRKFKLKEEINGKWKSDFYAEIAFVFNGIKGPKSDNEQHSEEIISEQENSPDCEPKSSIWDGVRRSLMSTTRPNKTFTSWHAFNWNFQSNLDILQLFS